jgi:hypothetical protein
MLGDSAVGEHALVSVSLAGRAPPLAHGKTEGAGWIYAYLKTVDNAFLLSFLRTQRPSRSKGTRSFQP